MSPPRLFNPSFVTIALYPGFLAHFFVTQKFYGLPAIYSLSSLWGTMFIAALQAAFSVLGTIFSWSFREHLHKGLLYSIYLSLHLALQEKTFSVKTQIFFLKEITLFWTQLFSKETPYSFLQKNSIDWNFFLSYWVL